MKSNRSADEFALPRGLDRLKQAFVEDLARRGIADLRTWKSCKNWLRQYQTTRGWQTTVIDYNLPTHFSSEDLLRQSLAVLFTSSTSELTCWRRDLHPTKRKRDSDPELAEFRSAGLCEWCKRQAMGPGKLIHYKEIDLLPCIRCTNNVWCKISPRTCERCTLSNQLAIQRS